MSENNENINLKRIPTSKLVLYMKNPELGYKGPESIIKETLLERLTKEYKLNIGEAENFIKREKRIIDIRGKNISNYAFDSDKSYEDLLRIFYENAESITLDANIEDYFNNLMMSELVIFCMLFGRNQAIYRERVKQISQRIKKIESKFRRIFNSRIIITNSTYQKIDELRPFYEALMSQHCKESKLLDNNKNLTNFMDSKLTEVMGYSKNDQIKTSFTGFKETNLLRQTLENQLRSGKKDSDINFDTEIINKYNNRDDLFLKKR